MIAYTVSRPGALVYVARNEKKSRGYAIGEDDEDEDEEGNDNRGFGEEDSAYHDWDNEQAKILCYGDVTLSLLPNPDGIRDLLGMEVDICLRWPTLARCRTLLRRFIPSTVGMIRLFTGAPHQK
jgi:hypothetical protein